MGLIGGRLAYEFLRWYSPNASTTGMDGSAYAGRNKLRVLLGDAFVDGLKGKDVLDFGCGGGEHAIALAVEGAKSVIGLDIQEALFADARERATQAGVADRVSFVTTTAAKVDAVVSLDSFEHFGDPAGMLALMSNALRPGGVIVTSFGPTWLHPLGGHLFSVFPWAHLLFTEKSLIRWRSDFRTDGARRFSEVTGGLNQITIARFERIVASSGLEITSLEAVPIRPLRHVHSRLTREFTTAIVRCSLRQRAG